MIVSELTALLGLKLDKKSWAQGDKIMGGLKKAIAVVGLGLGLREIASAIKSTVDLGGALNDTAIKTGLTVEALQFYGFVAKQNSSSLEAFAGATTKLSRGLDEAARTGKGPAADALKRLGINFRDAGFKALSMDQKVALVTTKLAGVKDVSAQTNIGMDLMGRSFVDLIPTIKDLGENGDALKAKFAELGGGLSGEQTKALDDFGDQLDQSGVQLGNLKNQIVVALLPTLKKMLTGFMEWVSANRAAIASGLEKAIKGIVVAIGLMGDAFNVVVGIFEFFIENAELGKAVVIALGIVIAAFAVEAAIAWVVAFAPVIAVIAAIAGLILIVRRLWNMFSTGEVNKIGVALAVAFAPITLTVAAIYGLVQLVKTLWNLITGEGGGAVAVALAVAFAPITAAVAAIALIKKGIENISEIGSAVFGALPVIEDLKAKLEARRTQTNAPESVQPGVNAPVSVGPTSIVVNVAGTSSSAEDIGAEIDKRTDQRLRNMLRQTAEGVG